MQPEKAAARLVGKSIPEPNTGCWLWLGPVDEDGYGASKLFGERRAHRAAWTMANGPIPPGASILHRCDNPPCINPDHLFLGDPTSNMKDRAAKGRYVKGDAHHWHARPETVQRGERHPGSKLSDAEVAEIRALYATGEHTQTALALRYGVSVSAVHLYVHNKKRVTP